MRANFKMRRPELVLHAVCLGVAVLVIPLTIVSSDDVPKSLVVTSILDAPFLMLKQNDNVTKYEGYCADLTAELAKLIGFNYSISPVKDGYYGTQQSDGSWNGMIGEIVRGEADVAIAPLTITSSRARVVEFSKPFMTIGLSIMLKKPFMQRATPGYIFLKPFSTGLWLSVLAAFPAVAMVTYVLARFIPVEKHKENADVDNFTLSNSLWYALRTSLQQGSNTEPRSISVRILSVTWWLFVAIVIALYLANLVVTILALSSGPSPRTLVPVESAEDLAKQTVIQYGTVQGGSSAEFFRTSKIPVYERMWSAMNSFVPTPFVKSIAEGVERVRRSHGNYALLLESTVNDWCNQRMPCDTMKVGPLLDSKGYGIAVRNGSALRAKIDIALIELAESGFLDSLKRKWWYDNGECPAESDVHSSKQASTSFRISGGSLSIENVAGVFYLLIMGTVLSVIAAVVEYIYAARKKSNAEKVEAPAGGDQEDKV